MIWEHFPSGRKVFCFFCKGKFLHFLDNCYNVADTLGSNGRLPVQNSLINQTLKAVDHMAAIFSVSGVSDAGAVGRT